MILEARPSLLAWLPFLSCPQKAPNEIGRGPFRQLEQIPTEYHHLEQPPWQVHSLNCCPRSSVPKARWDQMSQFVVIPLVPYKIEAGLRGIPGDYCLSPPALFYPQTVYTCPCPTCRNSSRFLVRVLETDGPSRPTGAWTDGNPATSNRR